MKISQLIFLVLVLACASCFQQINTERDLQIFYQTNSLKPFLHVYHNRHFKNSSQFAKFEEMLEELRDNHHEYLDVVFTDCEKDKKLDLTHCSYMKRTKDNRYIVGTIPSSKFRKVGKIMMQNPPLSQALGGQKNEYTASQLLWHLRSLLPNYYQELQTKDQLEEFLLPRYSPKLIAFIREGEQIPTVLKQIAVANFLKMDFGMITDLTESLVNQFKIKSYPSLLAMKYNFNQSKFEYHYFHDCEYQEDDYQDIRKFVGQFVLDQPRNDMLFHKINLNQHPGIVTVETKGELDLYKDQANGWVLISYSKDGKPSENLLKLFDTYGKFFNYINFVGDVENKIELYSPTEDLTFPLDDQKLKFNAMSADDFVSNSTGSLMKDFIVLGVVEKSAHICSIGEFPLFRGHIQCIVMADGEQQEVKKRLNIKFEIGFLARAKKSASGQLQTTGFKLDTIDYQEIYKQMDYQVRLKIKNELDYFLEHPVTQFPDNKKIPQVCSHPYKKCMFLLANLSKKDRTLQQYLKDVAFDFLSFVTIYEIDINANGQFVKAIGDIKDTKADLVAYNPRTASFVKLNKKLTKNLMKEFIKAVAQDDRRLKYGEASVFSDISIVGNQGPFRATQTKEKKEEQPVKEDKKKEEPVKEDKKKEEPVKEDKKKEEPVKVDKKNEEEL